MVEFDFSSNWTLDWTTKSKTVDIVFKFVSKMLRETKRNTFLSLEKIKFFEIFVVHTKKQRTISSKTPSNLMRSKKWNKNTHLTICAISISGLIITIHQTEQLPTQLVIMIVRCFQVKFDHLPWYIEFFASFCHLMWSTFSLNCPVQCAKNTTAITEFTWLPQFILFSCASSFSSNTVADAIQVNCCYTFIRSPS